MLGRLGFLACSLLIAFGSRTLSVVTWADTAWRHWPAFPADVVHFGVSQFSNLCEGDFYLSRPFAGRLASRLHLSVTALSKPKEEIKCESTMR